MRKGGQLMSNVLEAVMIVCFGLSWPINISKLLKSRTAKGTSVLFYYFIDLGYVAGIAAKFIKLSQGLSTPFYVWFFYFLNFLMVFAGIIIYYRNRRLDKAAQKN